MVNAFRLVGRFYAEVGANSLVTKRFNTKTLIKKVVENVEISACCVIKVLEWRVKIKKSGVMCNLAAFYGKRAARLRLFFYTSNVSLKASTALIEGDLRKFGAVLFVCPAVEFLFPCYYSAIPVTLYMF